MAKKQIKFKTFLHVGPRHVFFTSLSAQDWNSIRYQQLYNTGMQLTGAAMALLKPNASSNEYDQHVTRILQYIEFVRAAAENELANETQYIINIKSQIKSNEFLQTIPQLEERINNFLQSLEEKKNVNYQEMITLLTDTSQYTRGVAASWGEISKKNTEAINELIGKATSLVQEDVQNMIAENYSLYRQTLIKAWDNEVRQSGHIMDGWQQPITALVATRINSTIYNIMRSPEAIAAIKRCLNNKINHFSEDEIQQALIEVVIDHVTALDYDELLAKNGETLASEILAKKPFNVNNIKKALKDFLTTDFVKSSFYGKSGIETLEEISLTTRRNVADMFLSLSPTEQKSILTTAKNHNLKTDLENAINAYNEGQKNKSYLKGQLTKALNNLIRENLRERLANEDIDIEGTIGQLSVGTATSERRKVVSNLKTKFKDFFSKTTLEAEIRKKFRVKVDASNVSEFFTQKGLDQIAHTVLLGRDTELKTDIIVTMSMDKLLLENKAAENDIVNIVDNFYKNFLYDYKNDTKSDKKIGETDVSSAITSYNHQLQMLSDTVNKLSQIGKLSEEDQKKAIEWISTTISGGVQVKDYTFYSNIGGFEGGSLGSDMNKIMHNIEILYNIGGISPADIELIKFALRNCGPDEVANGIKEDLATFLVGGAAMMMFDDGFTASENFLQSVKQQFLVGPKSVHLYSLNGRAMMPASYIYYQIYYHLLEAYKYILTESNPATFGENNSNKVIIINNTSEISHKVAVGGLSHQTRWDQTAAEVESDVDIRFIFMAHMLDVFESIPRAFNI